MNNQLKFYLSGGALALCVTSLLAGANGTGRSAQILHRDTLPKLSLTEFGYSQAELLLSTAFSVILTHDVVAGDHRDSIRIGRKKAPYYCNLPLTVENPAIRRAIIVIHGSSREAAEYYDTILDTLPAGTDPARNW